MASTFFQEWFPLGKEHCFTYTNEIYQHALAEKDFTAFASASWNYYWNYLNYYLLQASSENLGESNFQELTLSTQVKRDLRVFFVLVKAIVEIRPNQFWKNIFLLREAYFCYLKLILRQLKAIRFWIFQGLLPIIVFPV